METLDYDHTLHQTDEGDKKLHAVFYMHFLQNPTKSQAEGRPIFDDVVFVKIFVPGDRTNIIDRPERPDDKFRFATQYARFKAGQDQRATGTPIEEWPIVTRGMAEELKFAGFSTVEQIAGASDTATQKMMGFQDLKSKAKAYLEVAKGNSAPIEDLTAKLNEVLAQNKIMQETIATLNAKVEAQAVAAPAKK